MAVFSINGVRIGDDDLSFQGALEEAKAARIRPLCLCRAPGIPMYIAQVAGRQIVKRMPDTGGEHSPACDSYEPPAELSGLGQVLGTAIQEDPDAGTTALKLDFALTKTAGRASPVPSGGESDTVKTDGKKLTLRSLLDYLWDQAGFNRWSPAMAGRRSWPVVRKYLLQAAESKTTKGLALSAALYVPEAFHLDRKAEIEERRLAVMSKAASMDDKGVRRLMVMIGEAKEIVPSRYGHKLVVKHLPDCHFMLNDDITKRMEKRFAGELELWRVVEDMHMIAIATFGLSKTGVATVEELSLMPVTPNWIPFDSMYESHLLESMTREQRRFVKGLRYQLSSKLPLAALVASDTEPAPTAMYIVPPAVSDEFNRALDELIGDSKLASWIWRAGEQQMPALPALPAARAHPARTPAGA